MIVFARRWSSILILLSASAWAFDVPALRGPVNDLAGMFSESTEQTLDGMIRQVQREGGTQIAILTVDSLNGEAIEQASIQVVDQWKLGTANEDNGVLMMFSKADRKARIEVGQGLEGSLTDAYAKRIIDEAIIPFFREGDFDSGVLVGFAQVVSRTNPDIKLETQVQPISRRSSRKRSEWLFTPLLILIYFFIMFGGFLRGRRGRRGRRNVVFWGGGSGFGSGGFGGGGFGGGGGGFSGGGASGGW